MSKCQFLLALLIVCLAGCQNSQIAEPIVATSTRPAEPTPSLTPALAPNSPSDDESGELPDFVWHVVPAPGEQVWLPVFQMPPPSPVLFLEPAPRAVCAYLLPMRFAEPGLFWSANEVKEAVTLTVDEQVYSGNELVEVWEFSDISLMNEQDEVIGSVEPGEYGICARASHLNAGLHQATVTLETPTGHTHRFAWQFELLETAPEYTLPAFLVDVWPVPGSTISVATPNQICVTIDMTQIERRPTGPDDPLYHLAVPSLSVRERISQPEPNVYELKWLLTNELNLTAMTLHRCWEFTPARAGFHYADISLARTGQIDLYFHWQFLVVQD